jgi:hypothetical protein
MGILRRYPFLIVLALAGAMLAVTVAWEIGAHVGSPAALGARPARRAAPFDAKLLPPPQVVQAEQQYPEFASRPLWTPTRRPAPAAAAPSTYTPGQYVLQGVIVAGNTKTAMLREKANGKLHRVEAGKQLNGITVAEISPDSVTLTQGADREVVPLQVQKLNPPSAVPPPGAQAGFGPAPVPQASFGPAPTQPGHPVAPAPPIPAPHPAGPFPSITPGGAPGVPASPQPAAGALPAGNAAANPLSAEELLARRRARRGQQTQ